MTRCGKKGDTGGRAAGGDQKSDGITILKALKRTRDLFQMCRLEGRGKRQDREMTVRNAYFMPPRGRAWAPPGSVGWRKRWNDLLGVN